MIGEVLKTPPTAWTYTRLDNPGWRLAAQLNAGIQPNVIFFDDLDDFDIFDNRGSCSYEFAVSAPNILCDLTSL